MTSILFKNNNTINRDILIQCEGVPLTVSIEKIPLLSARTHEVLNRLDLGMTPRPGNLSTRILMHVNDRREHLHSDASVGLIKTLCKIALVAIIISSICFLPTGPLGIGAFFLYMLCQYGAVLGLLTYLSSTWFYTLWTVTELETQRAALGIHTSISAFCCASLFLCHLLIPVFSCIEVVYHKYRWKQIAQIKQDAIAKAITEDFRYYAAHFHGLDKILTDEIHKKQKAIPIDALEQAQKELRAIQAFYAPIMEQVHKKIAVEIEAAKVLPTILSPIIAGYA